MKIRRIDVNSDLIVSKRIADSRAEPRAISGDNRELMRHSDGSLHLALIEGEGDRGTTMNIYGAHGAGEPLRRLVSAVGADRARNPQSPATDSNQNGVYVAYVGDGGKSRSGYVAHIPDIFADGERLEVHGPLTPAGVDAAGSFLQASRGYNSLVYSWRDAKGGGLYVGVSKDGVTFPEAKLVVSDAQIVAGPASGIYGDLVIVVYQTTDAAFAPDGYHGAKEGPFLAYVESGDGGDSWSKPARLVDHVDDLPAAVSYSSKGEFDLRRSDLRLSGATPRDGSLQALVWETMGAPDKRIFALASMTAIEGHGSGDAVGVLTWKPAALGAEWKHVLANRDLVTSTPKQDVRKRTGAQYKYCALPGSSIRVISYVEQAGGDEGRVNLMISVNMGDSFDYEASFVAGELGFEKDAELVISNSACTHRDEEGDLWQDLMVGDRKQSGHVRHVLLPVGINVTGMDPTLSW